MEEKCINYFKIKNIFFVCYIKNRWFVAVFIFSIIKCSEKCAHCDWSEWVHYISIKHVPMSLVQAHTIHHTFYKRNKKTCSSSIVELYKHLGILKNTWEVQEALPFGSFFISLIDHLRNRNVAGTSVTHYM